MKTPNPDHPIRNTLKHLALGAVACFFTSTASAAPPVTSGLKLHLDASQLTGLTDGATVDTWADMSGQNNHATRTVGAPTYETNELNGQPVVRFSADGNTRFDFTRISTIRTVFWVLKNTNPGENFMLGDTDAYDFHPGNPNIWSSDWANDNIKNGTTKLNGAMVNGQSTALPSASYSLVSVVTTGTVQANSLSADRNNAWGSRSWKGDMAEVLIYDRVLTTEEETLVGGYLTGKYGLMTTYPTNLSVTLTSPANNQAYLSGASITAAASVLAGTSPYTVGFLVDSGSGFVSQGTDSDSPYTVNLTGLAIGSYSIKAAVTDDVSATAESAVRTFTVSNAGPTNLAAVSSNQLVNLSWNQVLGATGYKVFRSSPDNSSYGEIATGITGLTYQDTGLTNGTPYYYVVKATVGATVSDLSNEVSSTPLAVDKSKATVLASAPYVWADGVATSTITVTLRDGGNAPVPGMTVTLASSRPSDDTVSDASGPSDENGEVTFTVSSSVVGTSEYTATVTDIPLTLTQKATVGFLAPAIPPPVTVGLRLHLDASQLPGLSDGATVPTWLDMSGLSNHANLSAGTPIYKTGVLNGQPVVRFDGNSRFTTADLSAQFPSAATVFVVTTINNDNMYSAFGNRNNDERWMGGDWSEVTPGPFRGGRANFSSSYSLMPTTGSHVFAYESDSSAYKFLLNGNLIGTTSGDYNSGSGRNWTIGTNGSGNGAELNGDIAELILYDQVLTAAEADQVGAYLATKYGLSTIYGPPTVVNYTPPDGETTAVTSDLVLTFNKSIAIGTGNITLKNLTDMTQMTIPIDDPQVSISGAVLTINPTDDLLLGKDYAVQIDAGAIMALSDAPFAGILDGETWNFATAPPTATTTVVVASGSPTTYGDSVTFTATVSTVPPGGTPSGGTVQFYNGVDALGAPVAVNTSTGEATYTTTTLGAATHGITAAYGGNYQFTGSTSDQISQVVDKAGLAVTAVNMLRLPNTANPDPFPYQFTGFKNGQTLGTSGVIGTPDLTTTAVLESPVGDYPITCTVGTLAADNYSFTLVNGTLTVADVADTLGVNFYADGSDPASQIQAGIPAGFDDWFTPGWTNFFVPFGVEGPYVVPLTSNRGSSATFTLNDARNGGATTENPRTTNLGDGNYSLMAALAHGTSDQGDDYKFDMVMSNIPFATYDVIFYFGSSYWNNDRTGKIVFNGAPERAFVLQAGAAYDGTFTEMVDGTTPGNYIVYTGVTGSSFTAQVYGDGFNHLGVTGFQIRKAAVATGFTTWAAANAGGQTAGEDYDNDGVENGIEYFMGETGSSFTALSGLDGTNTISWAMSAAFQGTYEVQTSPNLVTWTNVAPRPTPTGGILSYTLPSGAPGGMSFVRLLVTPAP